MTKKDYELIAGAIEYGISGNDILPDGDIMAIITSIARALQADNPHFDRQKFLKACGLED